MPDELRCKGKKKDGTPCGMRPRAGDEYCLNHSKDAPAKLPDDEKPAAAATTKRSARKGVQQKPAAAETPSTAGQVVLALITGACVVAGVAWALLSPAKPSSPAQLKAVA